MGVFYTILQFGFVTAGIIMIILVLLRKGSVEGLSGAFGGMGGNAAFGVKSQQQLDKIITYLAIFFVATAILLNTPKFRKNFGAPATPPNQEAPTAPGK